MSVTYYAVKKKPMRVVQITSDEIKIVKPSKSPQDVDVLSKKLNTIVSLGNNFRDISKSKEVIPAGRKQSPKIVSLNDVEKRITVPVLKSEKITNPKYLSFSEGIRQKIRQRAFGFVNHPDFKAGEVYLTFVLDSSGKLQDVKIIDEKTHANDFLRDVGLKSVRESGPFAPFPKDLNYAELTFNVIISFEMGEWSGFKFQWLTS